MAGGDKVFGTEEDYNKLVRWLEEFYPVGLEYVLDEYGHRQDMIAQFPSEVEIDILLTCKDESVIKLFCGKRTKEETIKDLLIGSAYSKLAFLSNQLGMLIGELNKTKELYRSLYGKEYKEKKLFIADFGDFTRVFSCHPSRVNKLLEEEGLLEMNVKLTSYNLTSLLDYNGEEVL